jgi:hypothetical protein
VNSPKGSSRHRRRPSRRWAASSAIGRSVSLSTTLNIVVGCAIDTTLPPPSSPHADLAGQQQTDAELSLERAVLFESGPDIDLGQHAEALRLQRLNRACARVLEGRTREVRRIAVVSVTALMLH